MLCEILFKLLLYVDNNIIFIFKITQIVNNSIDKLGQTTIWVVKLSHLKILERDVYSNQSARKYLWVTDEKFEISRKYEFKGNLKKKCWLKLDFFSKNYSL